MNQSVTESFAATKTNWKAISSRGWCPANWNLLCNPEVKKWFNIKLTIDKVTEKNKLKEMVSADGNKNDNMNTNMTFNDNKRLVADDANNHESKSRNNKKTDAVVMNTLTGNIPDTIETMKEDNTVALESTPESLNLACSKK